MFLTRFSFDPDPKIIVQFNMIVFQWLNSISRFAGVNDGEFYKDRYIFRIVFQCSEIE